MSPLYLYAVLGAAPEGTLGPGLAGEPLRVVRCSGLLAAAGEIGAPPALTPETLRGHDAVVRRLAERVDALLPARFGTVAPSDASLCDRLLAAGDGLRDALARVAGREQMILRVYAASGAGSADPVSDEAPGADRAQARGAISGSGPAPQPAPTGPGARYLAERARAQRAAADVPELSAIRAVLDRFVVGERVERHDAPPLLASVYHLIARGQADAYRAAVEEAARDIAAVRVTVSGPWAPYAFAPSDLQ